MEQNSFDWTTTYPSGTQCWYKGDMLHNEFGPAIKQFDGSYGWYLYHIEYTFSDYCDKLDLTNEEILILKIKYG